MAITWLFNLHRIRALRVHRKKKRPLSYAWRKGFCAVSPSKKTMFFILCLFIGKFKVYSQNFKAETKLVMKGCYREKAISQAVGLQQSGQENGSTTLISVTIVTEEEKEKPILFSTGSTIAGFLLLLAIFRKARKKGFKQLLKQLKSLIA